MACSGLWIEHGPTMTSSLGGWGLANDSGYGCGIEKRQWGKGERGGEGVEGDGGGKKGRGARGVALLVHRRGKALARSRRRSRPHNISMTNMRNHPKSKTTTHLPSRPPITPCASLLPRATVACAAAEAGCCAMRRSGWMRGAYWGARKFFVMVGEGWCGFFVICWCGVEG